VDSSAGLFHLFASTPKPPYAGTKIRRVIQSEKDTDALVDEYKRAIAQRDAATTPEAREELDRIDNAKSAEVRLELQQKIAELIKRVLAI
jgi:hypothetical protein